MISMKSLNNNADEEKKAWDDLTDKEKIIEFNKIEASIVKTQKQLEKEILDYKRQLENIQQFQRLHKK